MSTCTGEETAQAAGFRKSTYSFANHNCVEVGDGWRKSSRSGHNGQCTEVAAGSGTVAVRDTADRGGPVLSFPAGAWAEFLTRAAGGAA